MNKLKVHLSFSQQIQLLEQRNLKIKNKVKLKTYLKKYNYQNLINGFNDPFLKNHSRFENIYWYKSSDKSIISLFEFDRKISLLSWEYIIDFERILSTKISYFITEKMSNLGFKNGNIFALDDIHWNAIFKSTVSQSDVKNQLCKFQKKSDMKLLDKYKNDNEKPIWSMILFASFGTLSFLYDSLSDDIRHNIVESFKNINMSIVEFSRIILLFVKIRNRIGHNNVIYNLSLLKENKKQINSFIFKNNINIELSNSGVKFYDFIKILDLFLNKNLDKKFMKIYKKFIKNNKNIKKVPKNFIDLKLNIKK